VGKSERGVPVKVGRGSGNFAAAVGWGGLLEKYSQGGPILSAKDYLGNVMPRGRSGVSKFERKHQAGRGGNWVESALRGGVVTKGVLLERKGNLLPTRRGTDLQKNSVNRCHALKRKRVKGSFKKLCSGHKVCW